MKTSEVLTASADLIEVAGLYQKGSGHGGKCIVTAIEEFEPCQTGHSACDAVKGYLEVASCGEVIAWNDSHSQAEVVSMLRRVAELERLAEQLIEACADVQVVTL